MYRYLIILVILFFQDFSYSSCNRRHPFVQTFVWKGDNHGVFSKTARISTGFNFSSFPFWSDWTKISTAADSGNDDSRVSYCLKMNMIEYFKLGVIQIASVSKLLNDIEVYLKVPLLFQKAIVCGPRLASPHDLHELADLAKSNRHCRSLLVPVYINIYWLKGNFNRLANETLDAYVCTNKSQVFYITAGPTRCLPQTGPADWFPGKECAEQQ